MRREIVFVVGRGRERAGSAEMRARQLAELVRAAGAPRVRLACHDDPIRDAVAVVNKTAILKPVQDTVAQLRAAGCLVLADFVDIPIVPKVAAEADGFLAASILQARHLRAVFPGKPVIELPHAPDIAIPAMRCQWESFACGYFGRPDTAIHLTEVVAAGLVTAQDAMIGNRNGWIDRLGAFNLHYAVRPRRMWDGGFKPFTKGVTAARAGAVLLVEASDEEALAVLGDDYPFVVPADADATTVIARLHALRDGFGDASWQLARARMEALREACAPAAYHALIRTRFLGHPAVAG
jgi:hypothetical protein